MKPVGSTPPHLYVIGAPDRPGAPPDRGDGASPGAADVPALAVAYTDGREDAAALARRTGELLAAGTRWIWVVRLRGPRQVEVYTARSPDPARVMGPGEVLDAPGILESPVPVDALYDRKAAHDATLRNLLEREGYESLDAIREEGHAEGLRCAVRDLCELLGIPLSTGREALLRTMGVLDLSVLRRQLKRDLRWP